jgi:hypothetical protein
VLDLVRLVFLTSSQPFGHARSETCSELVQGHQSQRDTKSLRPEASIRLAGGALLRAQPAATSGPEGPIRTVIHLLLANGQENGSAPKAQS